MGNQQTKIPQDFSKTCHPALSHGHINKKQKTIELRVQAGKMYSIWTQNLNAVMALNRHLLVPQYFHDCMYEIDACCGDVDENSFGYYMNVGYPPFIYTLENEIMMRKMSNRRFREHEIWKLLKAGILAIRDWEKVYPDLQIGPITPKNLTFNQTGQIKLVHQFSFPQNQTSPPIPYFSPENRPNQVIKYTQPKTGSKTSPSHMYSLGLTILEAACLEQSQSSSVTTQQKKQFLDESLIYTLELKIILLQMTEEGVEKRAKLSDVVLALHKYKQLNE